MARRNTGTALTTFAKQRKLEPRVKESRIAQVDERGGNENVTDDAAD